MPVCIGGSSTDGLRAGICRGSRFFTDDLHQGSQIGGTTRGITYEEFEEGGGECSLEEPFYLYLDIAPDGAVWLGGAGRLGVYDDEGWREYAEEWMADLLFRPGFGPDGAVWYGPYVFYP